MIWNRNTVSIWWMVNYESLCDWNVVIISKSQRPHPHCIGQSHEKQRHTVPQISDMGPWHSIISIQCGSAHLKVIWVATSCCCCCCCCCRWQWRGCGAVAGPPASVSTGSPPCTQSQTSWRSPPASTAASRTSAASSGPGQPQGFNILKKYFIIIGNILICCLEEYHLGFITSNLHGHFGASDVIIYL